MATAYTMSVGRLTATVWDYGATLVSLTMPTADGSRVDVVRPRSSPPTLGAYDRPDDRGGYAGATVGRYANRIAHGRFTLDGSPHLLATNDGEHHMHGGRIGFDQYVWSAEPLDDETSAGVAFGHTSAHGNEGYPGALHVSVVFTLDDESLTIDHSATCDAPTIVNLTNHAYWNLAGRGTIADHDLTIAASQYVPVDAELIPIGSLATVAGTRYDFTRPTRLGDRLGSDGIDRCFVFDEAATTDQVVLRDRSSGRAMTIATDQPGVQLYTGNQLVDRFAALCLEPQLLPDTPNRTEFGSAVLRPGERYAHTTRHRFTA